MGTQGGETSDGTQHCMEVTLQLPPVETYRSGVDLTSQGEVPSCVYFIVEGVVKLVHVCPDGRERIVELGSKGELVAAQSAILGLKCFATATTATKSKLARWRSADFAARLSRDPTFSFRVSRLLSLQSDKLYRQFLQLTYLTARERFEALVRFWRDIPDAGGRLPAGEFDLPMSREELGQILSITPYHVSRLLVALEQDRFVIRQGRRIRVVSAVPRPAAATAAPVSSRHH